MPSHTPILDCEQPPPAMASRKRLRDWLPYLIGAAIGGVSRVPPLDTWWTLRALLFVLPAVYLAIVLHELGHVVAGSSAGFDLRSLSVGALCLTKDATRWRIRWTLRQVLAGGHARMVPRSGDRLVARYMRFAFGGPLASAAVLVIVAILLAIWPGRASVRVVFLIDLLIVVLSCLPYTWRGRPSDGEQLLLLIRGGPVADQLAAMLYLLALDTQRVLPRDWPRAVVQAISARVPGTLFLASAVSIRYVAALERGDPEGIAEAIEQALAVSADVPPHVRRAFYVAASCFHGQWRHDAARAEKWLEEARRVKGALPHDDWDAKALGVLALVNGDPAQAGAQLARYLAMLDRRPASGLIDAERARTAQLFEDLPARGSAYLPSSAHVKPRQTSSRTQPVPGAGGAKVEQNEKEPSEENETPLIR